MIALQDGFTMRRSLIVEDILLIEPAYKNKYPPIGLMKIAYFHRYIMHDYVRFAKGRLPEGLENKKWDKELLSQFTEWANEMSRQIRHRSYERSLTQSDKKFLSDESVTDVDGVDISLGTELDSYDMDDSDSVANTDLLSKLSLLMDMGKKKTKYNVLNLNSKFTVDQKQTLEHVFDALYAKYTNAKANDIIQTIIDSF